MTNEEKEIMKLLDRLYKELYLKDEVKRYGNVYDKFNNIKAYIDKLERVHSKVLERNKYLDYLKRLYYDKYIIKREDIPESYYQHQQVVALERGYGRVKLTVDVKRQLQDEIIENQKARIDVWLDYLLSEDTKHYPFWTKYWAFQGMLRLGQYDKEKEGFTKRRKDTIEPFADLNREALAMSIDLILKMIKKEEIEDKELEGIVKNGSFQKIYTYVITKLLKDNKNVVKRNIGKWVKYEQGSNHIPLVKSLQGYNTGWCTAGESTAKSQLQAGDFYIYYTLDENDEYKVPRIAIRMEHKKIAEIRGIAKKQNIEAEMEEVVEEKLEEFPDKEKYYKKVRDMQELTKIYKKHERYEKLDDEELKFLYEIENIIEGFGYEEDPRIEEIIEGRNKKADLAKVLNCREEQIALTEEELNDETVYFYGDLDYSEVTNAKGLKLPKYIRGYLWLNSLTVAEDVVFPEYIGGNLNLGDLTVAESVVFSKYIGGNLNLGHLTLAKVVVFPEYIGENLWLNNLTVVEDVVFPEYIGEDLIIHNLTSIKNSILPKRIEKHVYFFSSIVEDVVFPEYIGGSLYSDNLMSAKKLVLPQHVGEEAKLYSLTSTEGLIIPEPLTYTIHMAGFDITPENVNEYRNMKR